MANCILLEIGERYQLNKTWCKIPKGFKTILYGLLEHNFTLISGEKSYSAIIEVKGGISTMDDIIRTHGNSDKLILSDDYIDPRLTFTYVPSTYLEPIDNDDIINRNLANIWTVRESDHYTKFRRETLEKYGYDIHESIYKNRR